MKDEGLRWTRLHSEAGPEMPLFRVRYDTMQHPASRAAFRRLVLEAPDWVTVVAVTAERKVVMVEQYRFGIGGLTTEPVAGLVDEGEDSLDAAKRELLEETGFAGDQWRYLTTISVTTGWWKMSSPCARRRRTKARRSAYT